jgi:hypothetical protein
MTRTRLQSIPHELHLQNAAVPLGELAAQEHVDQLKPAQSPAQEDISREE